MSQPEALADKVYVELVRSLYVNVLPSQIMLAITAVYVALVGESAGSVVVWALGALMVLACIVRVVLCLRLRDHAMTAVLDRPQAQQLELAFAWPYYCYAALLGLFGGLLFLLPDPPAQMMTIGVLTGYCAGAATGTGRRPRIAIPSMVMAIGPAILASAISLEAMHIGMSLIACAFLAGGSQTVMQLYRTASAEIGMRMASVSLARRDGLTALPNRLALQEYFEENAALFGTGSVIAVHYLDLDGFKPVNDQFGHAAGDELLAAVADRLRGAVRSGDIVARLGGDEFGIVQLGLGRTEEADLLARRIAAAIDQPFQIDGEAVQISTSVGTVISSDSTKDLDGLLREADTRLYAVKRGRRSARSSQG